MGSYKAGADLSAKQYCFVKAGTVEGEVVACGAGEGAIGILMNAPASGETADVALPGGGAKLKTAAALGPGARVKSDSAGKGVAGTTTALVCAIVDAIGGNCASGDVVPVFVCVPILNAAS